MSSFITTKSVRNSNLFTGKKFRVMPILAFITAMIVGITGLNAQLQLTENFSYTASTVLNINDANSGHTGATYTNSTTGFYSNSAPTTNPIKVTASGTGLSYTGSPNSAVGLAAALTTSGDDIIKPIGTSNTSGAVYGAFMVNVSAAQSTGDYFFNLNDGTAYALRVFIKSSGTGFLFGLSKNGGTTVYETTTPVRTFNTTYYVVVKYLFNNSTTTDDVVSLFVNPLLGYQTEPTPTTTTTGTTSDAASISGFSFRQGTASNAPTLTIDGIMIGTSWASVTPSNLTVSPTSITNLSYTVGSGPSAASAVSLSGTKLNTGSTTLTITAPTDYEVSTTSASSGFGASATLSYSGSTLSATNFWVRLKAGLSLANYNNEVVTISDGLTPATTAAILASGSVTAACSTPDPVTSFQATSGNGQSVVSWTNGTCFDQMMVVISASSFTSAVPSGNGSAYTNNSASFTDALNTTFDGGKVIYVGTGTGLTITNLTNGSSYNVEVFTRKGSTWSAVQTTSISPIAPNYYWNGTGATSGSNVTANGGTGTWNTGGWVTPTNPGTATTWNNNNTAVFGGTAGIVTLDASKTAAACYFNTDGYTITTTSTFTETLTGNIILGNNVGLNLAPISAATLEVNSVSAGVGATGTSVTIPATAASGAVNRVNLTGTTPTISVPTTISGTGTGLAGYTAVTPNATISGNINNTSSTAVTNIGATNGNSLNVTGIISGSTGVLFAAGTSGGAGTITLSNNNNYTGSSTLNLAASGTLKLGIANALPTATSLIFNTASSTQGGVFDLNGFDQTVGSLSTVTGAVGSIKNGAAGTGTNTLTTAQTTNTTFGLAINNGTTAKTALAITGSGTLTLSLASSFSGGLSITGGGKFQAGIASVFSGSPTVTLDGGTYSTGATTGYSATTGSLNVGTNGGTISLGTGSHTLTIASSTGNTWGAGNLTVNGWTRAANTAAASAGKIIIASSGLTATQLGKISFTGFSGHAIFNPSASTEIIPDYVDVTTATNNFGSASYIPTSTPAILSVTPNCNNTAITGTPSIQWFSSPNADGSSATNLGAGARTASYTPSVTNNTASTITTYYYCVITYNNYTYTTAISGAIIVNPAPVINVSSLSGSSNLTYLVGNGPSDIASFTVSATYLTGAPGTITIDNGSSNALSYFELSTDYVAGSNPGTWSGTASINYSSATLSATTIYVRLTAGQVVNNSISETYISIYGGGATTSQSGFLNGSVTTSVPPVITGQPSLSNSTSCNTGSAISVTVTPGTDATPAYQWWYNTSASALGAQVLTANANSASYTPAITSQTVAGTAYYYYCTITDSYSNLATSDFSGSITINAPIATASVSIGASGTTVCSGSNVTFTATPTTNGGTPSYQWYLFNGTSWVTAGSNSNTFSTTALADQNQVKVLLTPTGGCVSNASDVYSNAITETVPVTETASLLVSGTTASCISKSVTFTASPSATPNTYDVGGIGASYDWYKNSVKVVSAGANTYTYTTAATAGTDAIYAVLHTATGVCVTSNTATSNTASLAISAAVPSVTTTSTGVVLYPNFTSTFAATASGSGTLSYQWKNNGTAIANNATNGNTATTANYTANSTDLTNAGSVTCTVTSSLGCSATSTGITVSVPTPTAFTAGKIVVERTSGTTSIANNLYIDEYNTTGTSQTPIMTVALPYSVGVYPTSSSASTNFSLTTSGSATSEGYITLSSDGKNICVPGYNAYAGLTGVATSVTSAPSTNYRALGLVDVNGIPTVPLAADFQSGNNIRSVASDGTQIWFQGAGGLFYFTSKNDNGAKTYASVNLRTMGIFNGKLFGSSASGTNIGINVLGNISDLGDNGSASTTLITSLDANAGTNTGKTTSPYGFVFNPTGDILYVADNGSCSGSGCSATGGIHKFISTDGSHFAYQYTLNTTGVYGIIGDFSGANPVLFTTSGTKLYSFTDAGNPGTATSSTSSITTLATTATGFKGLAWSPAATQNSYIYVNKNYLGNSFSGDFANSYAGTPTTTLVTAGKVNSFAIAGNFLSNAVVVTPDAGFEVSLDPSFGTYYTNASPLTIAAATLALTSTTSTQIVYVRFKPIAAGTAYTTTNVKITSVGAAEIDVPVTGTSNAASDYYYVGTGDLSSTANWTDNSDLSAGNTISSMSYPGVTWHLTNTKNVSLTAAWTLGANARIIVGDGTHAFNLTVPSGFPIQSGLGIEVTNASSLIWQDASSSPIFTVLDDGSTVNYAAATSQLIRTAAYSNLTLSGAGDKTFSGTYSISKTFNAGSASVTATGSTISFNGTAAQTVPGITYDALTISNAAGATLTGNAAAGNLTISTGTLYVPVNKSLTVTGTSVSLSSATSGLDIAGTFSNGVAGSTAATFTQTVGSTINCNYATTVYNHLGNGGSLPKATWNAASLCNVTGITTTNPTSASFAQSFGKFTWNNSGQTNTLTINTNSFGTLGLLDIESTGTSYFALAGGLANTYTYSINAITVNNAKFYTCVRTTSIIPTVNLTVAGNITVGGTAAVDLAFGFSTSAITYNTTLNAGGNIIVASTASFVAGNKNGTAVNGAKIIFTKSGAQTYTNASATGNIDFIINAGSTVTLGANLTQASSSTPNDYINNNGVLNLGGYTLTCGNINSATNISTGLFVANNGSLTVNGSTDNTINFNTVSANTLGKLTLSGTGVLKLGNNLSLTSRLTIGTGTTLDINGHNLTLKSTAAGTAEVDQVNGIIKDGTQASPYTATNVTVERYIPKGMRNYRDLGPSVANAGSVFNSWQEGGAGSSSATYGVYITGKTGTPGYAAYDPATGFDLTTNGNNAPSLYSCVSGNWAAVTTATGGTKGINLDPFKGLRLLVRGSRNFNMGTNPAAMPTATTLRATGSLVTGTVTFNPIGTGTISTGGYSSAYGLTPQSAYVGGEGWSFIANPYACPVSWSAILANTGTNVGNFYCFLDPTYQNGGLQRYVTVQYNTATTPATLTVTNRPSGIATDAACLNIQPGQGFWVYHTVAAPKVVIQETNKVVGGTQTTVFRTAKSNMLNVSIWKDIDGVSTNLDETVATFDNNYSKAIGAEDVKKLMNGAENIAIVEANTDLSINGIALPSVGDEIALSVGNVTANTAYQLKVDATQFDAPGVQAFIKDALLNTLVPAETVVNFTPTTDAKTYKNRFSVVFKSVKVVPTTTVKGSISIYPNPVTDKTFTLQTANVAAGKYNVVIVNSLGQEIFNTVINHKESATTESVKLNQSVVGGLYTLVLRNADGKVVANTELLAK